MNIATIKKWAFISGIIILIINVFVLFLLGGYYTLENFFVYALMEDKALAVLSILSSALLIYGITPINNIVNLKRSKAVFIIGISVFVYLIISLLILTMDYDSYHRNDSYDSYWTNALLLFISSAAMIVFGVKFSIKKEVDTLMEENEKSNDNINQI